MGNWRENVDPLIREHLESLISESARHRAAYKDSKNTANAQMWCTMALLHKQVFDLNLKVKFLEKALAETVGKKRKKDDIDASKALTDVLKRL